MSSNSQTSVIDRIFAYILSLIALAITSIGGLRIFSDYTRIEDFLLYRLSFNFSEGNGLVYDASEKVLPTTSPLPALFIGTIRAFINQTQTLPQSYLPLLVTIISAFGYALVTLAFCRRLQQADFSKTEIAVVIMGWLTTFPVWASLNSLAIYGLFFILLALHLGEEGYWQYAGIIAGLSILIQPEAALGCLALGLYTLTQERGGRYWYLVWLPTTLWLGIAAFYYTDGYWVGLVAMGEPVTVGSPFQNGLWIILLLFAIGVLYRVGIKNWLWILFLWASLELTVRLLVFGELTQIHSLALALTIPTVLVIAIRYMNLSQSLRLVMMSGGVIVLLLITILFPPQTEENLALDIELSRSIGIPKDTSVLHDRSDGIIRHLDEFTGDIYHFDGTRSPFVTDFVERHDYESLIIATAPDVIYFDTENAQLENLDLRSEALRPLNYRKTIDVRLDTGQRESDEAWTRRADVSEFEEIQSLDLNFGSDVQLIGYALDRSRPQPNEVLRIRLDWELDRPPSSSITIQLNLLDTSGNPVVSLFPIFDVEIWTSLELSTYHALVIPEDTPIGRLSIQVALDYKAAIVGQNEVATIVVPAPQLDTFPTPEGQINDVILYESIVIPSDDGLNVDLLWGVENQLNRDYQVLVHFTPLDDVQPLSNGDGPPVNGRLTTSEWIPDEVVPDSHFVPINDIAPGTYRVVVGFYILETFERLRGETGDSLTIAHVQISDDGTITILPPQ